ncbi:MAG: phosphotransferase [Caldilineaceae bacterium]
MMTLRLMQAVVATVDDKWESPLADELLARWAHDGWRAKFWRASTNFVFFFKNAGQDYVLRFNHADERTAAMIEAEVAVVNALAAQGVRVAKPMRSLAGHYVESVETDHGLFHAVVFVALPGKQLELEDLTPAQVARWGQALGELHNATAQLSYTGRPTWAEQLQWVDQILPVEEMAARQTLVTLQQQLHQLPTTGATVGLIHYDFELDNLFWDGEQIGLIDFDDSAVYPFVADLAFALSDLFDDNPAQVDLQQETFLHFVAGYRSVRPVAEEELQLIPLFLRVQNLVTYARLHRALTPVNPAGELPWMAGLREKLAAKMNFYRTEFKRELSSGAL